MRKTKVICTLGPAVDNEEMLRALILGGMMEEGFKLSLHLGAAEGNVVMFFFSRPQSLVLIALTVLSLVYSIWKEISAARKAGQAAA